MLKRININESSDNCEAVCPQFDTIHHTPLQNKTQLNNDSRIFSGDKIGSQNEESINIIPTDDKQIHVKGTNQPSENSVVESPKQDLICIDSPEILLGLTPEKHSNKSSTSAHDLSPVLESCFSKCWNSSKVIASTPANSYANNKSPERMNTEILDVLDRLCSPVVKKSTSAISSCSLVHEGITQTQNDYTYCGRSVKRLFDSTFENTSSYHQLSKRIKYEETGKCNTEYDFIDEPLDPFKEHDISECTLFAICEGTNHLVDSTHQEQSKFDFQNNNETLLKELATNSVHHNQMPMITTMNKTEFDQNNDVGLNSNISGRIPTKPCAVFNFARHYSKSHIIYPSALRESGEAKCSKVSLNDLLVNVKVLEYANKLTFQNSKTNKFNEQPKKDNTPHQQGFVRVEPITSNDESEVKLKNEPLYSESNQTKGTNLEQESANDSIGITDTQFCEVVEAAEMITDFNNCFNDVLDKTTLNLSTEHDISFKSQINNKQFSEIDKNNIEKGLISNKEISLSRSCIDRLKDLKEWEINNENLENVLTDRLLKLPCGKHMCKQEINVSKSASEETESYREIESNICNDGYAGETRHNQCLNKDLHFKMYPFPSTSDRTPQMSDELCKHTKHLTIDKSYAKTIVNKQLDVATGNKVENHRKCLQQVKHIFEECNKTNDLLDVESCSFQTVTAKCDKYSEMLLNVAQQNPIERISSVEPIFKGFYTASGKQVEVTEEALKHAKVMFTEEHETNEVSEESIGKTTLIMKENGYFDELKTPKDQDGNTCDESINRSNNFHNKDKYVEERLNGFNTASGKPISLSKKALQQAQLLFIDEENNHAHFTIPQKGSENSNFSYNSLNSSSQLHNKQITGQPVKGFCTASGKFVGVLDESLKQVKELLTDDNVLKVENVEKPSINGLDVQYIKVSCTNSNLNLEHKALKDIATTFPQGDSCFIKHLNKSQRSVKKCSETFVAGSKPQGTLKGFSTASGKPVGVSEKSLKQARQLLEECPSIETPIEGIKHAFESEANSVNMNLVSKFSQSQQPSKELTNNNIKLSTISMLKTAIDLSSEFSKDSKDCQAMHILDDENEAKAVPMGFHTARGKSVNVSAMSLKVAKQLYSKEGFSDDKTPSTLESSVHMLGSISKVYSAENVSIAKEDMGMVDKYRNLKPLIFEGFNTASGKFVNVSRESFNKARQLFLEDTNTDRIQGNLKQKNDEKCLNSSDKPMLTKYEITDEYGLKLPAKLINRICTTSECKVEASDDSLKKIRPLLNENRCVDNIKPLDNVDQYRDLNLSMFEGFNTASGKYAAVSKESLNKARQLFLQETNTDKIQENLIPINNDKCMYNLSDWSMLTKKKIVDENELELSTKSMKGFNATGGLKVDVLNDSLKKVKLFHENNSVQKVKPPCDDSHSSSYHTKSDNSAQNTTYYFQQNKPEDVTRQQNSSCMVKNVQNHDKSTSLKDGIPCNFTSSVISEEDLSLLNKSLCNNLKYFVTPLKTSKNEVSETTFLSTSIDREVSESMAALVADEESNSPFSKQLILKPILTSPAMLFDRPNRLPTIICDDNDIQLTNDYNLSPVLDSASYFKPTKSLKKQLFQSVSTDVRDNNKMQAIAPSKTPNFKPLYVTSTPKEAVRKTKIKHTLEFRDILPPSKRSKTEMEYQELANDQLTSLSVKEARYKAAEVQENRVLEKKKSLNKIKPCKGLYLLRKQSEKSRTLRSLTGGLPLHKHSADQLLNSGVSKAVLKISASSAKDFKFSAFKYFSEETANGNMNGVAVGDSALLVLDADGCAGVNEFTRSFQDSPAVDPSLAESSWIANHYGWIVLKLASIERMFPEYFANKCLTPNNLMLQLKYRYDRELDRCERPILRKILERDETPARTMVLFVADIIAVQSEEYPERKELELSDGWYSVRTSVDSEMENLIRRKKVEVGTKLVISGAELIGNEDGCNPLEAPAGVRLKASTNSCRRARWFARLGLLPCSPPPLTLRAVMPRGGAIQQLTASIARVYPLFFREKQPDGRSVVRSERAEQAATDSYQLRRQQCAETILSELQRDMESSRSKTGPNSLIGTCEDLESLNSEQLQMIQEQNIEELSRIQQQLQDKLANKLDEKIPQRMVTRMLKVRLISNFDDWGVRSRSALLTVWNPSDEVLSLLTEGSSLVFHHLTASGYSRFGDMQLTGGRNTRYCVTSQSPVPRTVTSLSSLGDSAFAPPFSEVDLVALVLQVGDTRIADGKLMYIADASYNFLCISFSTEIKETGYKSVLSPGCLVAISCLHWHSHLVSWSLPNAFASENTSFTQNPRQPHLQKALAKLRQLTRAMNLKSYMEDCSGRVESLIKQRNSGGITSTSFKPENSVANSSALNSRHLEQHDVSRIDSRTLCDSDGACVTPQNKRLLLLERYGEPPPISPLPSTTPQRVKQNFRPPMRKPISENNPM